MIFWRVSLPAGGPSSSSRRRSAVTVTTQTMTREQMKSVALEYLKRLDRGDDFFDLFADDAQLYFPKYGLVNGIDEIQRVYGSVGQIIAEIRHDYAYFNFICEGDMLVAEGTSAGPTQSGA